MKNAFDADNLMQLPNWMCREIEQSRHNIAFKDDKRLHTRNCSGGTKRITKVVHIVVTNLSL